MSAPSVERRKHPRFAAVGRLAGHLLDYDLPVRVRDIGLGGFSVETMEPLPLGGEHRVRFISQDDWSTTLQARLANCRPSCADDGSPLYVAGFQFLDDGTLETKQTVAVLVEKVTVVNLYGQVQKQAGQILNVLHEDDRLLVANKPAGLVCHPTRDGEMSSLIGRVRLHLGNSEGRLVNRLDRETSGVVLIAKTAAVARELGILLAQSTAVKKRYWAIVHGHVAESHLVIDAPLGRDEQSEVAIKDCVRADGAAARTAIDVVRRFEQDGAPFTWLDVAPSTGRKHQIRIHLAHVGHPVVGDKIYGLDGLIYLRFVTGTMTADDRRVLVVEHHALHARSLTFHWNRRDWLFEAPAGERWDHWAVPPEAGAE